MSAEKGQKRGQKKKKKAGKGEKPTSSILTMERDDMRTKSVAGNREQGADIALFLK